MFFWPSVATTANKTASPSFLLLPPSQLSPQHTIPGRMLTSPAGARLTNTSSPHRSTLSGPSAKTKGPAKPDISSVEDVPAVKPPSDSKRRRMERGSSQSRSSSVAGESTASSS